MKTRFQRCELPTSVAILSLILTMSAAAAPAPPKGAASKTAPPKVEPAEPEIPQSVFTIPDNPKEGRDPFFPNSTRIPQHDRPIVTPGPRTNSVVALIMNGIIPGEKPLVMINGRTFAPNETAEVTDTSGRRVRVTCIEIKLDSAIIEVNGSRKELHLAPKTTLK